MTPSWVARTRKGMASGAAISDELEAHHRAYLHIFRSILSKKGIDAQRATAVLAKLRQFMASRIQNEDDFFNYIPDFARALAVKPEQLSAYIGQHLLKTLDMARQKLEEERAEQEPEQTDAGPQTEEASDDEVASSILKEILSRVGGVVQAPDHFEYHDQGFMKFVGQQGEVLSSAFAPAGADTPPASAPPDAGATEQKVTGGAAPPAPSAAAPKAASPPPAAPEEPLIKEILEKCGNHLNVSGKLEPNDFAPELMGEAPAPPTEQAGPESAPAPANAAPGIKTNAPPPRAEVAMPEVDESTHLIQEILNECGNHLNVHGKLKPADGMTADSDPFASTQSAAPETPSPSPSPEPTQPAPATAPEPDRPDPIPFAFEEYTAIVRQLQGFQKQGDKAGYQQWLAQASIPARLLVSLRSLENRERKGQEVNWQEEYFTEGMTNGVEQEQVEDFHDHIRHYDAIQQLLNQFTAKVKGMDPRILQAVRTIWPQIRVIFNDESADTAGMMSRLKIPLLQVTDPKLKQHVQKLMEPLFSRVEAMRAERNV